MLYCLQRRLIARCCLLQVIDGPLEVPVSGGAFNASNLSKLLFYRLIYLLNSYIVDNVLLIGH